ncbi:site-specific DNA-methyltransferase [Candidatus Peregrinibacteria bacterium CG10_big_fil_rev_8_21_14_0_10_49_24]|nr:MAG: site-specific DNA-methyltransferase [Candidatus Peregrinibacteria bacterium CG10_big_fil_rev_8_21_14_0_10_49_24]
MTEPKKLKGTSQNPQEELIALFQEKCPEVFSDGKVDCEKLKATIGEQFEAGKERYGLTWAGKSKCFRTIQEPTTATLVPVREESVDFDTTKNIFIEGDNLEALKVLQKAYYGSVKMIYIDPPYNTGNDFIYNDDFRMSKAEYREETEELDSEGNRNGDSVMVKNTQDSGHYHSRWLNMMYPRLFLARQLLREQGVIFVSIDDNEVKNLRAIMDEIFGEENFVAQIEWQKRYTRSNNTDGFTTVLEHILVFSRGKFIPNLLSRNKEADERYTNPDNDPRGPWKAMPFFSQATPAQRPNLCYEIVTPQGVKIKPQHKAWRSTQEVFNEYERNKQVWWGKDNNAKYPSIKKFLSEARQGMTPINFWSHDFAGNTDTANSEIKGTFKDKIFDTPKPTLLIKRMLELSTTSTSSEIILDFFAGSGTTTHAVMALNAEDGGKRQCISVQLPEVCAEDSEAAKAGYKTIADIAKERIRRAGKKIAEESGKDIDVGFKAFKLQGSNFKIWRSNVTDADELKKQMEMFIDNVKQDSVQENILYELMLKTGLHLNTPTEKEETKDGTYFRLKPSVENGTVVIVCLEEKLTEALADKMTKEKPTKFICLDRAFGGNDQLKTNVLLQMEQAGVDFSVI